MRVVTARVHNLCDRGISVLNYGHSCDKFVNAHSSHSKQQFNIHLVYRSSSCCTKIFFYGSSYSRMCTTTIPLSDAVITLPHVHAVGYTGYQINPSVF